MITHQTFAEARIGQRSGSLPGRDSKQVKRSGTDPNQRHLKNIEEKRAKILKKVNKRERYKRVKSKKRYTILNPAQIDEMHQMDFVGPRVIKGYGAVSSLNLIDVD